MVHPAASAGFERSADAYDRARPEYPDAGVDWLWASLGLAAGELRDRVAEASPVEDPELARPLVQRDDVVDLEREMGVRRRLVGPLEDVHLE